MPNLNTLGGGASLTNTLALSNRFQTVNNALIFQFLNGVATAGLTLGVRGRRPGSATGCHGLGELWCGPMQADRWRCWVHLPLPPNG